MEELDSFSDCWISNCGIDGMYLLLFVLLPVDCPQLVCSAALQNDFWFVKYIKVMLCEVCSEAVVAELSD